MIKVNNIEVKPTLFPDNTSQVWQLPEILFNRTDKAEIEWEFQFEAEFMHLAQLVSLLGRNFNEITLHMPYLPYARQDKPISNESTFALQSFARLLNALELDEVTTSDVHSNIPEYVIKNFYSYTPRIPIDLTLDKTKSDVICFPDNGAKLRYKRDLSYLNKIYVHGEKTRDQKTGHITKYELFGDVQDRDVLIVDDICDGGMTFILLAKELYNGGAKTVNLYTTHGIYSKGLKPLREAGILEIYNQHGKVGEVQGNIALEKFE